MTWLLAVLLGAALADDTLVADTLNRTALDADLFREHGAGWRGNTTRAAPSVQRSVYDVVAAWDRFPKVLVPRGGGEACRNDTRLFLQSLKNFDMWALKMFDATAKLPSGILSGNLNQYGDFDQCLSVSRPQDPLDAQYCLASVQFTHTIAHIDSLVHAHHYMRSNLTDLGHRVPRFSSTVWGVCLPATCGPAALQAELDAQLAGTAASVRVDPNMCSTRGRTIVPRFGKFLATTLFIGIAGLLFLGSVMDDGSEGTTNFSKILNAFSLRRNAKSLFNVSQSTEEISGVSGVRCLNALALLMAHKTMALAHLHFVNRTDMAQQLSEPWTVIGRTAIIYTDTFLYLSGLLNAHSLLNELERSGTIHFRKRVIARLFRLLPLLACVMVFCTYILPDLGSGPQWSVVVEEHSRVCQRTMWRSFLLIHNFFGFENMCLTHTHQVGIDIQLYLVTPLFAWTLWRRPRLGWALLAGAAGASALLRYLAVYRHRISMVVYFGISVQNLLDAAKHSYILPTHRATIYLLGVAMAYVLHGRGGGGGGGGGGGAPAVRLSRSQCAAAWLGALALGFWAQLSPWRTGDKNYRFEPAAAAWYAAVSPAAWGTFLALLHWIIHNGYGGVFASFLDSRPFRFLNKIAYGVYLTQFPLYFYNVGVTRHSGYYTSLHIIYLPEIAVIIALSIVTTLAIEMPFIEIHRQLFRSPHKIKGS